MGRPAPRFHDFIGHAKLLEPIRRELAGAIARGEPSPHILLTGPSGVGKTLLAGALAGERGTRLIRVMGHASRERLIRKLRRLEDGDFLFIDEAHNLKQPEQELLFEAIDYRRVHAIAKKPGKGTTSAKPAKKARTSTAKKVRKHTGIIRLSPFTLVLATDRPGCLLDALRKRIPTTLHIPPYTTNELKEIVATMAKEKILLTPQAARKIAEVSHGLPRKAQHYLVKLRYFFAVKNADIGVAQVKEFLASNCIDNNGFGPEERKYLRLLAREDAASLETLALYLNTDKDDVQHQIEAPLIHKGLVAISSKGRRLTDKGRQWVQRAESRRAAKKGRQ